MGFDVLVLGAGSAGCVVAARLAETGASVGLIEAGEWPDDPDIADPLGWPFLGGREFDWAYRTIPQPFTDGRVHDWARGRVVGGSGCLNAMAHVHGHQEDFAAWGRVGGARWGSLDRGFARCAVPLLQPTDELSELSQAFMAAGHEIGAASLVHHNAGPLAGTAANMLTIHNGVRVTAADAYLAPPRANLAVRTGTAIERLHWEGLHARGVVTQSGELILADRVVICLGAVGSPLLLMRSGVGDPGLLAAAGIACRAAALSVGQGLQDHVLAAGNVYRSRRAVPQSRLQHSESLMYLHAADPSRRDGAPDIVCACVLLPAVTERFSRPERETAYTIMCGVTHPTSRGTIRPTGPHLADAPLIDPAYLSTEHDRSVFRESLRVARALGHSRALDAWREDEILPSPAVQSVAEIDAFLARAASTHHHPAGTCALGAVVDANLAVAGAEDLFVVDASVMPSLTTGPINAAVMAIAEIWAAEIGRPILARRGSDGTA